MTAFYDLSTCRQVLEQGVGPIPWDKMIIYAEYAGLAVDVTAGFVRVIRAMDMVFMEWYGKKQQKEMKKLETQKVKNA